MFAWYAEGLSIRAILARLINERRPAPRGNAWRGGAVQRILRNPKYTGQLVWGRTQRTRRPGTRSKALRVMPPAQWTTLERPDLRIVSDELWERVQVRLREMDMMLRGKRQPGRTLMRGRDASLHGSTLFAGFLTCGRCGKTVSVVHGKIVKGVHYRYYGCHQASRNGDAICPNRLKIRVETADQALLAGLQAALVAPDMVEYITTALAAAMNAAIDARPAQRAELERARITAQQKLHNLVQAIEAGAGTTTVFQAIADRETELRTLRGQLAAWSEPIEHRLAVMPTWVRQQLEDLAGLLGAEPQRARAEFRRLQLAFRFLPIHDEGPRPFYRAVASGDFAALAFAAETSFPTSGGLLPRSIGSREFVVDLPANRPGPGSRQHHAV